MSRPNKLLILASLSAAMLLAGCNLLFPEKMDATIRLDRDWSYTMEFTGVLTDYMTRTTLAEKGALTGEEQESLRKLEGELRADHRFRRVEYLGDEMYQVEFFETGVLQEKISLISGGPYAAILAITPRAGSFVTIEGPQFEDDAEIAESIQSLEKAGMSIDWRIRVDTDAKVVSHNAQKTPWLFGLLGAYEWHITSLDDQMPFMVVDMGQANAR